MPPRRDARSALRTFVLTVLITGLVCGTASFSCVPASQRLAAPIVCPKGTAESVVVSHVTRNDKGSIVTQFGLRCVDADGGSTAPFGGAVFGAMALYGAALGLLLGLGALALRRPAIAAAALSALGLAGCELGTLTEREFEARYPYGAGPMFSTGRAEAAARALEARLGRPPRVTGVTVSPDSVSFSVVSQGDSGNLDVWTYREEGFGEPFPEQTSEDDPVDDDAFPLRAADLARVTAVVRAAPGDVGIRDGRARTVSFSRDDDDLEFYVSVESAHRRGSARYDVHGNKLSARID